MPEAPPVTSAVLPLRSSMQPRNDRKSSKEMAGHLARPAQDAEQISGVRRGLAEQYAAFHLVHLLGFHERHYHGARVDLEILHHRVGDVLHQSPLLVERAPPEGIDHDFRHCSISLPCRMMIR